MKALRARGSLQFARNLEVVGPLAGLSSLALLASAVFNCGTAPPPAPAPRPSASVAAAPPKCTDLESCAAQCEQKVRQGCDGYLELVLDRGQDTPDLPRALRAFEAACSIGNSQGCDRVGMAYRGGTGVRRDLPKAIEYFGKCCEMGNAEGCSDKAQLMFDGRGTPADVPGAMALSQKACEAGYGEACSHLATIYRYGAHGTAKDTARAAEFDERNNKALQAGCNGGSPRWCGRLAREMKEKDESRRTDALQKACEMGNLPSCDGLADRYQRGLGITRDPLRAYDLHARACLGGYFSGCEQAYRLVKTKAATDDGRAGDLHARYLAFLQQRCDAGGDWSSCSTLAEEYNSGRCIERNPARGLAVGEKMLGMKLTDCEDRNFEDSCLVAGRMLANGNLVTKDLPKALGLFEKGCENDEQATACQEAGLLHFAGSGVPRDGAKAVDFLGRRCAKAPQGPTCVLVGRIHQFGYGVPQDFDKAEAQYLQGCETNNESSCVRAGSMALLGEGKGDMAKALEVLDKACKKGVSAACDWAGDLVERGVGMKPDLEKAATYYRKACDSLNQIARGCTHMGLLLESGRGVKKDPAAAADSFKRGCDLGEQGEACSKAAAHVKTAPNAKNTDEKDSFLRRACNRGEPAVCAKAPLTSFQGFDAAEKACRWEPKGFESEPFEAAGKCMIAAYGKEQGLKVDGGKIKTGGTKDLAGALELYEKACLLYSHLPACGEAGRMAMAGQGIKADKKRAIPLLRAACIDGSASACNSLRAAGGKL